MTLFYYGDRITTLCSAMHILAWRHSLIVL